MRFNPDEYITVSERIEKFYVKFPQGRIITTVMEHSQETGFILMRAEVYREPDDALPAATGHAYELRSAGHVQAGSYVEVCETSSVGRALALLGFEVRRGVASREEVVRGAKKQQAAAAAPAPARPERPEPAPERPAATPERPAAAPERPAPAAERAPAAAAAPADAGADLDSLILQAAEELGYDAAKVRKWVNQKYEVTGGLGSLTPHDKREVLKIFTEQARSPQPRAGRK
jgi:pyruvate/2-oxoglutarate dehydrogenase complex dihydrolipoamide acyltransferase (E2) component